MIKDKALLQFGAIYNDVLMHKHLQDVIDEVATKMSILDDREFYVTRNEYEKASKKNPAVFEELIYREPVKERDPLSRPPAYEGERIKVGDSEYVGAMSEPSFSEDLDATIPDNDDEKLVSEFMDEIGPVTKIAGAVIRGNPTAESNKFYEAFEAATKQDCIAELIRINDELREQLGDDSAVVTRDYFRSNTGFTDKDWTQHFGKFAEFKAAAGLGPTAAENKMLGYIAKAHRLETYDSLNKERVALLDGVYLRPDSKRYQTMMVCSDIHCTSVDPFWLHVFLDTVKRIQPETLVIVGDLFDFPEFGKYNVDPRDFDPAGRVKFVHEEFLEKIREVIPTAQIDLIAGNHSQRLMKYISENAPALQCLLDEIHGMTIAKLLGLDKFSINYYDKVDFRTTTLSEVRKEATKNYKVYHDQFLTSHFPHAANLGMPGCNGHEHRYMVKSLYNETFQSYQWTQLGAGHKPDATFCMGEKWSLGFGIVFLDTHTKESTLDYCEVKENHAIAGGVIYIKDDAVGT